MNKNKLSPLVICHIILLSVCSVMSVASAVIYFRVAGQVEVGIATFLRLIAWVQIINITALIMGVVYLVKSSSGDADLLYRLFMLLMVAGCTVAGIANILNGGFVLMVPLTLLKITILVLLAFLEGLGKRNSWILFWIMFVLDVGMSFLYPAPPSMMMNAIVSSAARLLVDGTVGFALKNRYPEPAVG